MSYYGDSTRRDLEEAAKVNLDTLDKSKLSQLIIETYKEKDRLLNSLDAAGEKRFMQILTIYSDSMLNKNSRSKGQKPEEYNDGISKAAQVTKANYFNKDNKKRRAFTRCHAICFCFAAGMNDTQANIAIRKLFGHNAFHNRDYCDLIFSFFLRNNSTENCVENFRSAIKMIERFMPTYESLECDYRLDTKEGHYNDLTNHFCKCMEKFTTAEELADFLEDEDTKYEAGKRNRMLLTVFYFNAVKISCEIITAVTKECIYDKDAIKNIYKEKRNDPELLFSEILSLLKSTLDPYYRYLKKEALLQCGTAYRSWRNMYNYACEYFDSNVSANEYVLHILSHFNEDEIPRIKRAIKKSFLINVFTLSYYGGHFSFKDEFRKIVGQDLKTNPSDIQLNEHYEPEQYDCEEKLKRGDWQFSRKDQNELFPFRFDDSELDYIDKGCVSYDLAMATDLVNAITPPDFSNSSDNDKREKEINSWVDHCVYQKTHICKKVAYVSDLIALAAEVCNNSEIEFNLQINDIDPAYLENLTEKYKKISGKHIEVSRKTDTSTLCDRDVLMFCFYTFAILEVVNDREEKNIFDDKPICWKDIIPKVNRQLDECGISQLDPYNPLDYLIILSVNSSSPFMYVQGVLDVVRDNLTYTQDIL